MHYYFRTFMHGHTHQTRNPQQQAQQRPTDSASQEEKGQHPHTDTQHTSGG